MLTIILKTSKSLQSKIIEGEDTLKCDIQSYVPAAINYANIYFQRSTSS
jgi:hypothetical protein